MGEPGDLGYFGPESVSWQVHREVTVLFGGARAVLMQAAHPLVIAGARKTGFYERNPWKRLQRTLILTYTMTFGSIAEAHASADRINDVHARIGGIDDVTGLPYDALDPDLLLYVHACLVDSALLFEERAVGRLDEAGRQRFHEEQMLAAELVKVPRSIIPATVPALRRYLEEVAEGGMLRVTDASRAVADLFLDPPHDAEWRPVLRVVSKLAFGTLPPPVRAMYGVDATPATELGMRATFAAARALRPLLPPRYRFIAPYNEWRLRQKGRKVDDAVDQARRAAGIRLGRIRPSAPTDSDVHPAIRPQPSDSDVRRTLGGMDGLDGVLLDIDGVLALSWRALPGAVETVDWLRSRRVPFRLLTNTTTHTRDDLAAKLREAGIAVEPSEIITAVVGTATYLRTHRAGARVYLLTDGDARDDMDGIRLVEDGADIVVIGGACEDFSYVNVNRVFRMLAGGAELVGMHRNLYWRTSDGLELDGGAYIAGLEQAASVRAMICGKPAPAFFQAALDALGVPANRAAMVGDDVVNDVLGAQAVGIAGVLVQTGKYSADDAHKGDPHHVISSIGDLPALLEASLSSRHRV